MTTRPSTTSDYGGRCPCDECWEPWRSESLPALNEADRARQKDPKLHARRKAEAAVVEVMQREMHSSHPDDPDTASAIIDRLIDLGWGLRGNA